jgi:predicted nucleic acid-binding protein
VQVGRGLGERELALVGGGHEHHDLTMAALEGRRLGLSGHAAFEAFSVLTRLPAPSRRPFVVVARLLSTNFPVTRFLSERDPAALVARLREGAINRGAVHDALVGAAAREHGLVLATLDRRALGVYRGLGVEVELLAASGQG